MKYSFFKVLLSLKVVKFDTKMYLNFSNFRGRTSAGGGDKPWSKNGDKCQMGGIGKIFAGWGDPPSPPPPGKKPCYYCCWYFLRESKSLPLSTWTCLSWPEAIRQGHDPDIWANNWTNRSAAKWFDNGIIIRPLRFPSLLSCSYKMICYRRLKPLRGYCTSGPYFLRLCAFSQKIKQLRTKYPMDLVRNVPRNSKITVLLQ